MAKNNPKWLFIKITINYFRINEFLTFYVTWAINFNYKY